MLDRLRRLIREGRAPLALIALVLAIAFVVKLRGKAPRPAPDSLEVQMSQPTPPDRGPTAAIAAVIESEAPRLMAIPGVHGMAEGRTADGRPCILLLVEDPNSPALRELPDSLGGYPVQFDVTDTIKFLGGKVPPMKNI